MRTVPRPIALGSQLARIAGQSSEGSQTMFSESLYTGRAPWCRAAPRIERRGAFSRVWSPVWSRRCVATVLPKVTTLEIAMMSGAFRPGSHSSMCPRTITSLRSMSRKR